MFIQGATFIPDSRVHRRTHKAQDGVRNRGPQSWGIDWRAPVAGPPKIFEKVMLNMQKEILATSHGPPEKIGLRPT